MFKLFESFGIEYAKKPIGSFDYFLKGEPAKREEDKAVEEEIVIQRVDIDVYIEGLDDVLSLIERYPLEEHIKYNINMKALHNIKEPLMNLSKLVCRI